MNLGKRLLKVSFFLADVVPGPNPATRTSYRDRTENGIVMHRVAIDLVVLAF